MTVITLSEQDEIDAVARKDYNFLVVSNLPFVRTLVNRHYVSKNHTDYEDFVHEGVLGLMDAAKKFDPSFGRFQSYARMWIRGYVSKYASSLRRMCRYPDNVQYRKAAALHKQGKFTCFEDVMAATGMSGQVAIATWLYLISGDEDVVHNEGEECVVGDYPSPEEVVLAQETSKLIQGAIGSLPSKHGRHLQWQEQEFELMTDKDISINLGYSKARAMKREQRARGMLKEKLAWYFERDVA